MKTSLKIAVACVATAAVTPGLSAQTAASPTPGSANTNAPEEVVELTPFEVRADTDNGYVATQTLAGTRIRTDLRDVGSAISVITREFLVDIGATDNNTLLQYTTNAEVAGTRGTYAGLGNGTGLDESGNLRAPGAAQRVRGLAAADNTRDFFVTDIPWDAFNVERIDIQRGPNSILFGLGSPAGIVNATTRGAEFRNRGSAEARVGSYGSLRGSLDYNHELIDNTLALRVAGLWDEEKFQQDPAFENDERVYGALRFDPQLFARRDFHTSIKVRYEHGDIDANRPRIVPPNDAISAWFRPRAVSAENPFGGMGRTAVNNGYDAFRGDVANITPGDGRGLQSSASPNYQPYLSATVNQQQPMWFLDGITGQLQRVSSGYINTNARNASGGFTGSAVGVQGRRYSDQFFQVATLPGAARGLQLPNADFGQYRNESLQDPSVFDFYNTLIDGPNKSEWEKWDAYNVDFSQTGWEDRFGLQLTYDRQKYYRGGDAFFGGTPTITMDILRNPQDYYLTSGANGTTSLTNPNFGRPYIATGGGGDGSDYRSDREYMRGSLFAELRARDFFESDFMVKLLGRQRLNGVYSDEEFSTETRGWVNYANNQAWAGFWNGNSGSGSSITDRPPTGIVYLGSSIADRTSPAGANIPGVNANLRFADSNVYLFDSTWQNYGVAFNAPWTPSGTLANIFPPENPPANQGGTWVQAQNPANYAGWNSDREINLLRFDGGADLSLLTRAQLSKRETMSYAGSWQGYFWNDAIIPTLGWRYDVVKSKAINAQQQGGNRSILNLNPDVYRLPDGYPANLVFKDHSTSGGVVVHLNRLMGSNDRDVLPINVSVSYNKSSNFQVTDARRDIYGNTIANPTGSTKEYGVILSTKDDKYSFRAIKYETKIQGGSSGISDPGGIGRVIAQGLRFRNVFLYDLGVYDWNTRNQPQSRNTWGGSIAQGDPVNGANQNITSAEGRALEDAAIRTWNDIQRELTARGFFQAWGFEPQALSSLTDRSTYEANPDAFVPPDTTKVFAYGATPPPGFTVTADTISEGYEFELTANPTRNWRLAFNASQTEATRTNVGGQLLDEYIAYLDSQLNGTPAGNMPQFGNTGLSINANVYGPWRSNYVLLKLQEGAAAPEIREWRYNFVTNYSFTEGRLKGFGVGGSYRWQDKVIIGYPVVAGGTFDLSQPYHGPSEDAIDLWASYSRRLTDKIDWRIQLNIRNAFADEGLIPISVQPDGRTWAGVRVKPVQEWFVTNTFSF